MGDFGDALPFELAKVSLRACQLRENIANRFPGDFDGIALDTVATVLGLRAVGLKIIGIQTNPVFLPSDCVAVALSVELEGGASRLVLGLSASLADRVVNLTLGREGAPDQATAFFDERLISGEKGALMFCLDAAGGDWLAAGGGRFTLKALLFDGDQIPDYLQTRPTWEAVGQVEGPGISGRLWLWGADPVPAVVPRTRTIGDFLQSWKTSVHVTVAVSRVPSEALYTVEPGDRLLLDDWQLPDTKGGDDIPLLQSGNWRRYGRWLDNRRFEVIKRDERIFDMERTNEAPETPVSIDAPESETAGDIVVTVDVEVGSFQSTIRQASKLVPGRIVKMDKAVGPDVALKVQGKLIGRGVLVDHEGTMAVEIKEVLL